MNKKEIIENELFELCKKICPDLIKFVYINMTEPSKNIYIEKILVVYSDKTTDYIDISRTSIQYAIKEVIDYFVF